MLSAQLFISICAVALAGWTLAVTNELIRERDRLRERVIQLEETMAARGEMPPSPSAVVRTPVAPDYPQSIDGAGQSGGAPEAGAENPIGRVLGDLFAPPPPMHTVVLHARSEDDAAQAQRIAAELTQSAGVRALVAVAPRRTRTTGYTYYDGRQSRAAAALVQQFNDIARREEIAAWSAQLRGTALPAQGEYTADRLDILLPALPAPPRPDPVLLQPQIRPPSQTAPVP
jgi:hypothetical protein